MINLRYHIVSLTAVFLAIGIGLTLGSTFLDRATVDNLQGQLESLETRLEERDQHIEELDDQLGDMQRSQSALDEQGSGLLAGQLEAAPVVIIASRGVDESDLDSAVQSLQVAGADVRGQWWLTDRFLLADDADVADLAAALGEESDDPARLRRTAISALGRELRVRQQAADVDSPAGDEEDEDPPPGASEGPPSTPSSTTTPPTTAVPGDDTTGETTPNTTPSEGGGAQPSANIPVVDALAEAGFVQFEAVTGGADAPSFPPGTRVVLVGGSPDLPDDVVLLPLVERLALGATEPVPTVVTSAMDGEDGISDIVAVIREDERLRTLVSTVDNLEHFQDWAALVLAVADVDDAIVGHFGIGEGATRLLPPLRTP